MADPGNAAVLVTAIGTAVTGGILAVARLIEVISDFVESRRDGGSGGGGQTRRALRRARRYERKAKDIRDHYRHDDDDHGSGGAVVPFEQAWVMP